MVRTVAEYNICIIVELLALDFVWTKWWTVSCTVDQKQTSPHYAYNNTYKDNYYKFG